MVSLLADSVSRYLQLKQVQHQPCYICTVKWIYLRIVSLHVLCSRLENDN